MAKKRYTFTKENCSSWHNVKDINPITRYPIKVNALYGIFNQLQKQCTKLEDDALKLLSTQPIPPTRRKKEQGKSVDSKIKTRKDINKAFKTPQTPPNAFKTPQTPPNAFKTPQTPPNAFKTPQTPNNAFKTPQTPNNAFKTPQTPNNAFKTPQTPNNAFKTPQSPPNAFKTPQSPPNAFKTPQTPNNAFKTPQTPNNAFKTPQSPPNAFKTPQTPNNAFKTPQTPNNAFKTPQSPQNASKTPQAPNKASDDINLPVPPMLPSKSKFVRVRPRIKNSNGDKARLVYMLIDDYANDEWSINAIVTSPLPITSNNAIFSHLKHMTTAPDFDLDTNPPTEYMIQCVKSQLAITLKLTYTVQNKGLLSMFNNSQRTIIITSKTLDDVDRTLLMSEILTQFFMLISYAPNIKVEADTKDEAVKSKMAQVIKTLRRAFDTT
jgi:hypothetical protein